MIGKAAHSRVAARSGGGRSAVRNVAHMAVLSGASFNPSLAAMKHRLAARGKVILSL